MKVAAAIQSIRKAGFLIDVESGKIAVEPFSKLTPEQLEFLRRHKSGIIAGLQSATVHDLD